MKLTKYLCHVLMIKDKCQMIELAYFHKDSVTTCEEIKKYCNKEDYIKEDREN